MPIKKLSGRQEVIAATADFVLADLANGVYNFAVDVPAGAMVVGGGLAITVPFNSATTDVYSIGDKEGAAAASVATYAAVSADINVASSIPIVVTGKKYLVPSTIGLVWTGTGGGATVGTGRLTVLYVIDGRAAFSQG